MAQLNSWEPLANDLLRERIAHIGKQSDLHKLYPYPFSQKFCQASFKKPCFPPFSLPNDRTYSTSQHMRTEPPQGKVRPVEETGSPSSPETTEPRRSPESAVQRRYSIVEGERPVV